MNPHSAALVRGLVALFAALALALAVTLAWRWPIAGGLTAGLALFGWMTAFGVQALRRLVSPGALAIAAVLAALGAVILESVRALGLVAPEAVLEAARAATAVLVGLLAALLPAMLAAGRLPTLRLEP